MPAVDQDVQVNSGRAAGAAICRCLHGQTRSSLWVVHELHRHPWYSGRDGGAQQQCHHSQQPQQGLVGHRWVAGAAGHGAAAVNEQNIYMHIAFVRQSSATWPG